MKKVYFAIIVMVLILAGSTATFANNTATVDSKGNVYVYYEDSDMHCIFIPKSTSDDGNTIYCDVYVVEERLAILDFPYVMWEEPENEQRILYDIEIAKDEES